VTDLQRAVAVLAETDLGIADPEKVDEALERLKAILDAPDDRSLSLDTRLRLEGVEMYLRIFRRLTGELVEHLGQIGAL
jgi:hypothetical protein